MFYYLCNVHRKFISRQEVERFLQFIMSGMEEGLTVTIAGIAGIDIPNPPKAKARGTKVHIIAIHRTDYTV